MSAGLSNSDDMATTDSTGPEQTSLPLRMLNEFAYCPRLFHLMHVDGRWADNAYTVEGRNVHRRVDALDHLLPDADTAPAPAPAEAASPATKDKPVGDEPPMITRSVPLSSSVLGITAKLDLVSSDGTAAVPVETKRGRVPHNPERSWPPERIQLMAQGLMLREHGYQCDHGILYFAGSRTRVDVPFTPELEALTRQMITNAQAAALRQELPPPLDNSPKCNGCSLAGICLPDETLAIKEIPVQVGHSPPHTAGEDEDPLHTIRRLFPARPDATPLYVQEQGAYVGKSGNSLIVRIEGKEVARVGIKDVSQLVLCGNVQASTQTLHLLCEAEIPVVHLSTGMWFYGITHGISLRNAYDRAAQFDVARDSAKALLFAKHVVRDKGENQRTMLRRNVPSSTSLDRAVNDLAELIQSVKTITAAESLLGVEGAMAAIYFANFSAMLSPRDFGAAWDFTTRNRRPPRDPVNAMLSFAYAMLAKECTIALLTEGLDPWWGLYHRPRHGRPALALDMMEPFRPVIADSAVITAINTGMVRAHHFETTAAGCAMNAGARKALLRAYEARLDQLITHPAFGYRCSWRSVIRLQAQLLARWFRGDVPTYDNVITR